MLFPQPHRTLRGTWLEVLVTTDPEKEGELSLTWELESSKASQGEGKSRWSVQSWEKEEVGREVPVAGGRSQTTRI